jgi:hypothetical protein
MNEPIGELFYSLNCSLQCHIDIEWKAAFEHVSGYGMLVLLSRLWISQRLSYIKTISE